MASVVRHLHTSSVAWENLASVQHCLHPPTTFAMPSLPLRKLAIPSQDAQLNSDVKPMSSQGDLGNAAHAASRSTAIFKNLPGGEDEGGGPPDFFYYPINLYHPDDHYSTVQYRPA